ncbi:UDP-N-acetylglucosamine 2-epimerase [Paraburkholderia sp. ZP32-5]|uniref:UDP-N-acetylglucosamine 2-epimerase n=1 Tax=Paraburkholderia sp. ZP32-5 TaxID=2883245 RepID=UPI003FA39EEF
MKRAILLITDSGGNIGRRCCPCRPVLSARERTERSEAVAAGTVRLVGTDQATIICEAAWLRNGPSVRTETSRAANPYGDGTATLRIRDILVNAC